MDTIKTMHTTLHDMITDVLNNPPSGPAFIFDDIISKQIVSFEQLTEIITEASDELAKHCKEGELVGISSESSLAALYLFLSVVKIKAIACPLNVHADTEQFVETCIRSQIKHIIIEEKSVDNIPDLKNQLKSHTASISPLQILNGNLAIITFEMMSMNPSLKKHGIEFIVASSGSTGVPKMIKVPGKCIVPNILDLCNIFEVSKNDVIFMSSPLTFDASIVQIFVALIARSTLLVVPDSIKKQPSKLSNILFSRNHTTILQATPSLVHLLGESLLSNGKTFCGMSLRILCLGAEQFLPRSIIKRLIGDIKMITLYNIYGISEVSSWASIEKVSLIEPAQLYEDSTETFVEDLSPLIEKARLKEILVNGVPIGEPLTGTVIEVRLDNGQVISNGIGEIWAGGAKRVCLVGDETELIPNTMRPTGDIGCIRDGKIYYLQRKDHRLKIFGHFIDLEMIETAVEEIPEVKASICIAVEGSDKTVDALMLFLSLSKGKTTTNIESIVARKLSRVFPMHGLQFKIEILEEMPLNAHGKKDRIALRKFATERKERTSEVCVWETSSLKSFLFEVLQNAVRKDTQEIVSYKKESTFIENGGDSFAALFVVNRIGEYLKGKASTQNELNMLYDYIVSKKFSELCEYVRGKLENACESNSDRKDTMNYTTNVLHVNEYGDASNNSFTADPSEEMAGIIREEYSEVLLAKANSLVFHDKRARSGTEDTRNLGLKRSSLYKIGNTNASSVSNDRNGTKRRRDVVEQSDGETINETELRLPLTAYSTSRDPTGRSNMPEGINEIEISDKPEPRKEFCSPKVIRECYCSVSRANRYTVCRYCLDLGNLTGCLSSRKASTSKDATASFSLCIKWRYDTSKCVDASPLVVCSRDHSTSTVFIGSHSHSFVAIDASNGNVLWNTRLGDRVESSAVIAKCGKKIIVGCYDHYVYVLSRKNGEILWKFKTGDCVKCSPIVNQSNGIVYVGSHDQFLYALDIENHLQIWRVFCGGGSCFSSPSISADLQKIFIGTLGGSFLAVGTAIGEVLWTFKVAKPIFSSPVVYGEFVCFSCVNGIVYMLEQNGTLLWKFQTNGPIFSSACLVKSSLKSNRNYRDSPSLASERDCLDNPSLKSTSDCQESPSLARKIEYLQNTSLKDGSVKSPSLFSNSECLKNPSLKSTNEYIENRSLTNESEFVQLPSLTSNSDCILIGSHDNHLYCLTNSGHLIWKFEADSPVYPTPAILQCRTTETSEKIGNALQRNFAVVCSSKGMLYIIDLTNGELHTAHNFAGKIFSSPVVVGNSIVVGCRDNNVYCIQLQ